MGWRLIDTDLDDPFFVTAADDALLQTYNPTHPINTIHLYRRNTPTISMGRSRQVHQDINREIAQQYNVTIIRRTTGGGTIFTDPGCLIYSIIYQPKQGSSQTVFTHVCSCLITMFQQCGLSPEFKAPNDILIHGRKISGSAQRHHKNCVLIHGTILVSTNVQLMQQVLNLPHTKSVTTMEQELHNPPTIQEVKHELLKVFEQEFQETLTADTFSRKELEVINHLIKQRYKQEAWTHAR